jgi:DNA invertase Pin-like site-specific DNA recombinase
MSSELKPAAEYLRMSTEHQQYSIENQSSAIRQYAERHGFTVVRTYSDPAKSGLLLRHRAGLRELLKDVAEGKTEYKAILSYDVSRWGRFQDTDEAAHYEFLCKSAGIPVHYCAEPFANDGSLSTSVIKALKRAMAGEYSRELGVKVLQGQTRLAKLGFKQGGPPGYGLRRMLVSSDGEPKQLLADGERKSIATDRVILVPGPANELRVVREIYRMFLSDRFSIGTIAHKLNRRGISYLATKWDYHAVQKILTHPKYMGCHVFNQTSCKLCTPRIKLPISQWVFSPAAFKPIIEGKSFRKAQQILCNKTGNKSDQELLHALKTLLTQEGRLTLKLIKHSSLTPSPSTYRYRFGTMRHAFHLIGYGNASDYAVMDPRRRSRFLRRELMERIVSLFPGDVSIKQQGRHWRGQLALRSGLNVSVLIAPVVSRRRRMTWQIHPVLHEAGLTTLVARLAKGNLQFLDFHVLPNIDRRRRFYIDEHSEWLKRGVPLPEPSEFCAVIFRTARLALT